MTLDHVKFPLEHFRRTNSRRKRVPPLEGYGCNVLSGFRASKSGTAGFPSLMRLGLFFMLK